MKPFWYKGKNVSHEDLLKKAAFTVYTAEEIDAKLELLLETIRPLEERCQNLEANTGAVKTEAYALAIAEIQEKGN